jgi:hypothetical protein
MATWYEHSATTFDPETGLFSEDMKGLVTNVAAGLEGANNAPYNEATWHPYNGLKVGDANTGVIYDFAVSGGVTTITTPDFVDGYEYMLRIEALRTPSASPFTIALFRETGAAFTSSEAISSAISQDTYWGEITIPVPRANRTAAMFSSETFTTISGGLALISGGYGWGFTASKILRARITAPSATTAGRIIMYKRRAFY